MPSSEGSLVSESQREQIVSKKMQSIEEEDDADSDSDVPPPPPPPSSEPISSHEPSSSSSAAGFIPEPQLYPALAKKKAKSSNRRKSSVPAKTRNVAAATVKKTLQKKNAQQSQGVRKKHRFRPGTVALREIRKLQKGTDNLVPKRAVVRLIKEIMQDFSTDMRLTKEAAEAIQCIAETFVVELFEDSNLVSINSKRVTVMPRDIRTVQKIKGRKY